MDPELHQVQDAIICAKAKFIIDSINRLNPLQFAVSTLLALRQTREHTSTCTDGCGKLFSKCPRWEDDSKGLEWVNSVLESYNPTTTVSICGTCLLPNPLPSDVHPQSSIANNHKHKERTIEDDDTDDLPTKVDIFGPGLLLLLKEPIRSAMGIKVLIDTSTIDPVVKILALIDDTSSSPLIQRLFLLCYHLLPTTAHSPDAHATAIHAASQNQAISLPPRMANKTHINAVTQTTVDAAIHTVIQMETRKPISGTSATTERYVDGTTAKVTIEWQRTQPKSDANPRAILAARCKTIIKYIDAMTEYDAKLMFCIIAKEHRDNMWRCPCGTDTYYSSCDGCPQTVENRLDIVQWVNAILSILPGNCLQLEHNEGSHCLACLLPRLPVDCPREIAAVLAHNRPYPDPACIHELPLMLVPAIASLFRTSVREVMGYTDPLLPSMVVSNWLATPWLAIPSLSKIHRLYLLHYFLLPTTRHSPLAGGFTVIDGTFPGQRRVVPYQGPSEANLVYMKELEDSTVYAAIESVRPMATGTRTVEMGGLDGTVNTTVSFYP